MWRARLVLLSSLLLIAAAGAAWAGTSEQVVELWRGGSYQTTWSIAANPADGSCWVGGNFGVAHLDKNGQELWRSADFHLYNHSIAVDPRDGSCWLTEYRSPPTRGRRRSRARCSSAVAAQGPGQGQCTCSPAIPRT